MNPQHVYIAGKVTGEDPEVVLAKFAHAQNQLESQGHKVLNPIEIVGRWAFENGLKWHEVPWGIAMRICLREMNDKAASLYMLPCWPYSRGAKIEHNLALELRMPVFYEGA